MTPGLGELGRKIMREARKPGKGVLTDDPNGPDGKPGVCAICTAEYSG
ncbi:MAG: hypothetical protein HDQ87_05480 [Clostridia bacterium]|nr:hypothetical protein [Clostridia bacterium]